MAITRQDETELLTALHEGPMETPPWQTFLERLQRRTGANHAAMMFRRGEGPLAIDGISAGQWARGDLKPSPLDPALLASLRPNRVYSSAELPGFADTLPPYGRILRVSAPGGYESWLTIARDQADFGSGDGALLAALAPHLVIALRVFATIEKERLRAGISGDAMRRLNFGWITLDASGAIIDLDAQAERLLHLSTAMRRTAPGQLRLSSQKAERALKDMVRDLAAGHPVRSRAIHLSDEPWLDMLVTLPPDRQVSRTGAPMLVAYVHGDEHSTTERQDQLMALFGLSRNEARLALSLSRGRSIAQSAKDLGLTLETTRLYSKRIYAKTGTSGQADLVRLILASIVALV